MTDNSTPKSTSTTVIASAQGNARPRKATIDFLRQFARCYMAAPITSSTAAVILN